MKVLITEFHTQNLLLYFMFRVLNSINAEQEVLAEGHDHTLLSPLFLKVWWVLCVQRVSKAMISGVGYVVFAGAPFHNFSLSDVLGKTPT